MERDKGKAEGSNLEKVFQGGGQNKEEKRAVCGLAVLPPSHARRSQRHQKGTSSNGAYLSVCALGSRETGIRELFCLGEEYCPMP